MIMELWLLSFYMLQSEVTFDLRTSHSLSFPLTIPLFNLQDHELLLRATNLLQFFSPEWLESCDRLSSWRNRSTCTSRQPCLRWGWKRHGYISILPWRQHTLTIDPGEPSSIHEAPVPGRQTAWLYLVSGTNQRSWRARGNGDQRVAADTGKWRVAVVHGFVILGQRRSFVMNWE